MSKYKFLIAECGATTCNWAFIENEIIQHTKTDGYNPNVHNEKGIKNALIQLTHKLGIHNFGELYFYGSGLGTERNKKYVQRVLDKTNFFEHVYVYDDIQAAARAAFGNGNGIVGNLGTGSFAAIVRNGEVKKRYGGLGYILGDEGSASHLGKLFLSLYLNGSFSKWLNAMLLTLDVPSYNTIRENVYDTNSPHRFLVSMVSLIKQVKNHEEISNMIKSSFTSYFLSINNLKQFEHIKFVGGIANEFSRELHEVASCFGLQITEIIKEPIHKLVAYHQS